MAHSFLRAHRFQIVSGTIAAMMLIFILIVQPSVIRKSTTELQKIQQRGYLKVLTLNSASTYYQDIDGENGFEFELASWFSEFIGVEARFITVSHFADLYPELLFGSGDIAAAGLSENESQYSSAVTYGPGFFEATSQVVYRKNDVERPRSIEDLIGGQLRVISGTRHARLLSEIRKNHPLLLWIEDDEVGTEELIEEVDTGQVDFIVADSHEIALQRRFFPELRIAFDLEPARQLRWAYNTTEDNSLRNEIERFFKQIKTDGRLDQLIHRHFSYVAEFNYSDLQTFTGHIRERLPQFEALFKAQAVNYGIDWQLLAAIGYQESLWNARAKSPTGVRGLMMLTQPTAKQMKVTNRLDPKQSIEGGARYFNSIHSRIPKQITEPDRTWFALASYNVGLGHVEDARKLTEMNGADPNKWIDVRDTLPLLARKKWYKQTKYGYARGWEPVKYVKNVRTYYGYLVAAENKAKRDADTDTPTTSEKKIPLGPSL